MIHLFKFTSILAMLCLASSALGQCLADFDFDDSSLVVNFDDKSMHITNDSIILHEWNFGDGITSDDASPLHIYAEGGAHDVTLIIATELGCMDTITKSIYICNFELDYDLQLGCDEDNKVTLDLHIKDSYSSAEEINVYLDGDLLNDIPLGTTNDTVSIATELLADGQEHTIDIQSINHPSCIYTELITVAACVPPCYLSNLKATITNNGSVSALVTESGYNPEMLNVATGDTIKFKWTTNNRSVTSNPNNNGQNWDSGILNTGDEYQLYSFAPGIFSYTSSNAPAGIIEGSLVSTCPDSAYYDLILTFQNEGQSGAYELWIDGVPSYLTDVPYSIDGFDTIPLIMPGDGVLHTYAVIDASSASCNLYATVQAPLCGVTSNCNLHITAAQSSPCNQDSIVDVAFTVLSAGGGINGFDLYVDEILHESNIAFDGTETIITRSFFGDGEEHTIKIVDTAQDTCIATTSIVLEDCTQTCMILNAFAGVGSNNNFVTNVLDDSFSPKDITISAGDKVIWQWQTDTLRSVTAFDFLFDSGVKASGSSYTSPTLPIGVHRYYSEFNGMEGSVTVEPNCVGGLIPIVYNFNKFGGANTGYNIYVDSIKINSEPIAYADNGNNSGNSQVVGNGALHQVQIVDAVDTTCNATQIFAVPFCDESTCALYLENPNISTCNANNTIDLTLDLLSYNTLDSLFAIAINGIITDTLSFDTSGITSIDFNLPGDGNTKEITVFDLSETLCDASFSFNSTLCNNPCDFGAISIDYILESPSDSCFDGNAQLVITTEAVHSFNSDYTISLTSDNININETHNYPTNGIISHVYTLVADGELIDIEFTNNVNSSCQIDTLFNLYSCNPDPCILDLTNLSYDNCRDGGLMDMMIEIDTFRISDSISILFDDDEIFYGSYIDFYATPIFEIGYNGEERKLNLIDIGNDGCMTEDLFFTDFCPTDCILDVEYMLSDSCILAEDTTYNIIITGSVLNAVSDSILIDLVSSNISSTYSYEDLELGIILAISRADDNPTLGIFDLADDSCRKFLSIDAPNCILDCNISIDTAIVSEENCINGITTISFDLSYGYQDGDSLEVFLDGELVNTALYPTDSLISADVIGDGLIHTVVIRDNTNTLCSDTLDLLVTACDFSCSDFSVDFGFVIDTLTKTVTYTDQTIGAPDNWDWNLGDGTISSDANPFHTYTDFGLYTICLTAQNVEEGCIQSICQDIELIDIDCNADFSYAIDGLTLVFQSLSTSAENITDLEWAIDGNTTLENVTNGSYTANESGSIELCLSIETITGCNSHSCETIEVTNPCNITPLFEVITNFDTIQLINSSMGVYTNTTWAFGDGFTFSGNDIEYIYPQDGNYEVCMTVSDSEASDCEFTICEMVNINSCEVNAVFLININQDTLNAELIGSLGNFDISWDFGNGFSANIDPVQFVYTVDGDYTVCATVTDTDLNNCTETHCEEISIILTDIESELLNEIKVYPNPLQIGENIRIINKEGLDLTITLYSNSGQKLNTNIINQGSSYILHTQSLSAGKYLVQISSKGESIVKSIILVE